MKRFVLLFLLTIIAATSGMAVEHHVTPAADTDVTAHQEENDEKSAEPADDPPPATEADTAVTGATLQSWVLQIDPDAEIGSNTATFTYQNRDLVLVFDDQADRMRLISPIAGAGLLDEALMLRLLQANYDAALDARYAVANGLIWSVFIHPLSSIDQSQLASAIYQTYQVAESFGTSFSSGLLLFGGGDSGEEQRKLLEQLQEQLNPRT